jgi:hypothetical protein
MKRQGLLPVTSGCCVAYRLTQGPRRALVMILISTGFENINLFTTKTQVAP